MFIIGLLQREKMYRKTSELKKQGYTERMEVYHRTISMCMVVGGKTKVQPLSI